MKTYFLHATKIRKISIVSILKGLFLLIFVGILRRIYIRMRNLSNSDLAKILNQDIFHLISKAADALSLECYVVGGYVRDFIFRTPLERY